MSSETIPLVDFGPFLVDEGATIIGAEPTAAQLKSAQTIDRVCREHGFLCLTNYGMDEDMRDRIFAVSKELFDLPNKEENLARIKPETNMGYAPFRSENINRARPAELKEAFNIRYPPKHVNDLTGCPKSFVDMKETLLSFYKNLAHRYAIACALALQLPSDFFSKGLDTNDLCTIRLLHYPPCDWEETDDYRDTKKPIRIGEHTDFGMYTFLMVHPDHGPDGLQIKSVTGGEMETGGEAEGWKNVSLPNLASGEVVLIVNTGALMARWTNDEWNATAHRVVVTDKEAAGRSRYSVACFVDPDADSLVDVHPKFCSENQPKKYDPITSNDYLMAKLSSMMKA